ncbi:MAG: alpha-glucosidase/alpha-galactosidase [Clostridiales bacterium]|jgi:alpha-galactosidase|nr:alpha-glucosidase/alpha-galactosidase [Clostridiales bacterium]
MNKTDARNLRIAYVGGGSRAWAWTFMTDLAIEPELSGEIRLYDIDKKASENNEKIGSLLSADPEAKGLWSYKSSETLEDALDGADFVIISILPGTFDEMQSDVHLPERLGIYQSVGDTAGPGGIIRALRTIPMFEDIAKAIKKCAPDAWVINYTNPMSLCCRVLYEVFPKIKAFGCCHEVFGTQKLLAGIAEEEFKEGPVDWHDIHVNVLGLNHFTWFTSASWKSFDLFPAYAKYAEERAQTGYSQGGEELPNTRFHCVNKVKFDLFRQYGWIAAAGDRHLAEFMPGERYLKDPECVAQWGFHLTDVDWRKKDLQDRLARSEALVSGKEKIKLKSSGEEGILLIKALSGLGRVISNVNLPNTGHQICGVPQNTIVETNAVFSLNSIKPVSSGRFTKEIAALMKPHIENQQIVLGAALMRDRNLVYEAFEQDPLVAGRCSEEESCQLVDDMIANTLNYLPKEWSKA